MIRDDRVMTNAERVSDFQESRFDNSLISSILSSSVFDFEFDSMSDFISYSEWQDEVERFT